MSNISCMAEPLEVWELAEQVDFYGAVTVGERGQVVIPAAARRALSIRPGDKLLTLSQRGGRALVLVKLEDLVKFLEDMRRLLDFPAADTRRREGE